MMRLDRREHAKDAGARQGRGYAWALLALLTCPCHLPLVVLLLSGTAAGAFIGNSMGIAMGAAVALFGVFVSLAIRAFKAAG